MQLVSDKLSQPKDILLSVIVPVYNEEQVLPIFHHRLDQVLSALPNERLEVIYVNDGSSDDSWEVMLSLSSCCAALECINLSRNFGKEAAMTAGIDHCKGQAVMLLDADLQDPPELIPDMLAAWQQGFDVVNMKRTARHGESWFKKCSAGIYYKLLDHLADVPVQKNVGDFRLISRRVIDEIKQLSEKNRYMKGILSWPGYKQTTIEFDRPAREAGKTKWSFPQLVGLALSGITAFSVKPLRLSVWAGVIISLAAFLLAFWVLIKTALLGEVVQGYPSLMLVQLLLGGVQLIAIGVCGEYIGRIYTEVKGRPCYLVMEIEHKVRIVKEQKKHA
ncbi:glycosyltransferase family 2 protein [Pseudoalteromonas luteoviolacea]|uniref:Bactoprenol glucosyl transferase n=1 Tax=Pseudoalteromonas luteoviolacea S4054 TaxID=1129367 RepID=A0A0F6AAQ5_9GAMM|nr:glycosyltransferase family 2 protein [Pseudoalteromonas luteoviolacea]AOT08689.1 glycosyl transferase family 2 [Pseudoalteromonas luteoviolacea]AOT13604.1 glycosyl transferase family 2 [Pseudoalteromonas luteoviolacea]AOT18517.1 glycosyl transferase family 2 [Pseudoalteromonas luteoviolacea]KKE82469.1 bactoprenol glucosyl transferase [Pseudoalteromonas luteoviolacea S4054]KZN71976.1 bactoprenol glucosyl transferase [Pseudoalteromonas luteoviolacea S4047-1]